MHDVFLMQHLFTYGDYNPGPTGRHRPGATPCGLFQTCDGWIVLTVLNHQWERFAKDIGKPDLLTDGRFNPSSARWENRHDLEPIIEEWCRSLGSREEVLKFLLDRHYLTAPVLDLRQTVDLIKREGRGALQPLNVPGYGDIPLPKVPYMFSETTVEFQPILSMVGEDNRDILSHYLGYSEQKLDDLQADGILIEDSELAEIRARRK
jgi:crotonobetainyl-CoA:carnitine CoA-transferase CaiB-like acyl-CoA transferase